MHVLFGIGDLIGLLRKNRTTYPSTKSAAKEGEAVIHGPAIMAEAAGAGETNHSDYDFRITDSACDWLRDGLGRKGDKPWLLYVSFVLPHFPLIAPKEFYDLYPHDQIPVQIQYGPDDRPSHLTVVANRGIWNYDDYFDEAKVRRARAGYYGLCSFLDHNIGRVLAALEETGEAEDTRIIYTSDHGDHLGDRGIWSCSTLYEESVGVPMIMAGPGVPEGKTVDEVVSLVDLYPTILESLGESAPVGEADRPGTSLLQIANGKKPSRTMLSEYHAGGSITGSFMVRNGPWKYPHHVGYSPQLFNLQSDPLELEDLGENPGHAEIRAECEKLLRQVVDPDATNARAFADQAAKIESHGGVEAVLKRGHFAEHGMDRNLGVE